MPLKLVPPRAGKSTSWTIRGTHLGVVVDRSAKTADRKIAAKQLGKIKDEIETGTFAKTGGPTFSDAASDYMRAGGSQRFLKPLLLHFRQAPLSTINQAAIDKAAEAIYPAASAATRNRQVYTPVSAILRRARVSVIIQRPKGAKGTPRTAWLDTQQAFALLDAAKGVAPRFGALLSFLLYTGARLSEGLSLKWNDVNLDAREVLIRQTKTEGVRMAFIPDSVMVALTALAPNPSDRKPSQKVFGLAKNGHLYNMLNATTEKAGVEIPERVAFHIFRHTWATWMRRHAGLDTAALVETGAWRSRKSASVYEHLDATAEAKKVALLPGA